jgi:endogenous inhibitor of DNA gyrase (YacG/DUF329 family)
MARDPVKCVYCRAEPVAEAFRPFCSERCKMSDLGRWLKGDYAVPARETSDLDTFGVDNVEIEDET